MSADSTAGQARGAVSAKAHGQCGADSPGQRGFPGARGFQGRPDRPEGSSARRRGLGRTDQRGVGPTKGVSAQILDKVKAN